MRENAAAFADHVLDDCAFGAHGPNLHLSGALCDAWDRCAAQLGKDDSSRGWRERIRERSAAEAAAHGRASGGTMAARRAIGKREAVLPTHYLYDDGALALGVNRDYFERVRGMELHDHDDAECVAIEPD